jgi:hypothetical protein
MSNELLQKLLDEVKALRRSQEQSSANYELLAHEVYRLSATVLANLAPHRCPDCPRRELPTRPENERPSSDTSDPC